MSTAVKFSTVVGLESAKRALLLALVEPGLKGVLIGARAGSGKSTLARSLKSLLGPDAGFVELPVSATEDRLLGSLDLTETLRRAARQLTRGLLAEASGGVLYVDSVNLLERRIAQLIASALDSGFLRVEREGVSAVFPTRFTFVGAYDPAEGEPAPALRDCAGLLVVERSSVSVEDRVEVLATHERLLSDPFSVDAEHAMEIEALRRRITAARERLAQVRISRDQIATLCSTAIRLGVTGNRIDILAVRTARANAAFEGRVSVEREDVEAAVALTIAPRASSGPSDPVDAAPPPSSDQETPATGADSPGATDDIMVQTELSPLPDVGALDQPTLHKRDARGRSSGKQGTERDSTHGRYVRSSERAGPHKRVALDATLRAAVVRGSSRRLQPPDREPTIKIKPDDLRFKQLRQKSGILFVFAVDASGSMALGRLAQAKGALIGLLQNAYVRRDSVALISFRGESAEVLLPPTRSVAVARRLVDALPAGGGTPVAAGLLTVLELARTARRRSRQQVLLVILTDGRANVGLRAGKDRGAIAAELSHIATDLLSEGIASVVLDTAPKFVSRGEACELAEVLRARYVYLPRPNADKVQQAIDSVGKALRENVSR